MIALSSGIHILFTLYTMMLFARILGSWFPNFQQFSFMRFIHFYTEPYLKVFRRIIPRMGMIDLSPLIAFFALRFFEKIILRIIH